MQSGSSSSPSAVPRKQGFLQEIVPQDRDATTGIQVQIPVNLQIMRVRQCNVQMQMGPGTSRRPLWLVLSGSPHAVSGLTNARPDPFRNLC